MSILKSKGLVAKHKAADIIPDYPKNTACTVYTVNPFVFGWEEKVNPAIREYYEKIDWMKLLARKKDTNE